MATIIDPITGEEVDVPYVSFEDESLLDTIKRVSPTKDGKSATIPKVTRVEVIDSKGRSYVNMNVKDLELSYQDDGRTLKLFIK